MSESIICFDTETTGIPRYYKAPVTDLGNWPRLVQLGWVVYDGAGALRSEVERVIAPDGFTIPEDAARVHGITTEIALERGLPLRDVLVEFVGALSGIDTVVGHNLAFDLKIVGAEFVRCSVIDPFPGKRQVCTMLASTAFCMIPGAYGYKWPKLNELYTRLFARDMGMAHNSLLDVKATMDCFFELKKIGVLS